MCGRYTLTIDHDRLQLAFGLPQVGEWQHRPRYNIAPSQEVPVIIPGPQNWEMTLMVWGLIPHWAKDRKLAYNLINARAETLAEKPSFRDSFRRRRCLIPADGFYEWTGKRDSRQPLWITKRDGAPFAFAGLYDRWITPPGEPIYSFTIITTEPNPFMEQFHHRMPVILTGRDAQNQWMTEGGSHLLGPLDDQLVAFPVSNLVNSPKVDEQVCIAPLGSSFFT